MWRELATIVIFSVTQFSSTDCFQFTIARDVRKTNPIEKANWCYVNVFENESVDVRVDIPLAMSYSGIFLYFANEEKEILKVSLNKTVEGEFYEIPYKLKQKMQAQSTVTIDTNEFHHMSGQFPLSWLPKNCSKISAAVQCVDGRILNYYGIQNLDISFPDLMVLEEFKNYKTTEI